jgi:hypothetical protein
MTVYKAGNRRLGARTSKVLKQQECMSEPFGDILVWGSKHRTPVLYMHMQLMMTLDPSFNPPVSII